MAEYPHGPGYPAFPLLDNLTPYLRPAPGAFPMAAMSNPQLPLRERIANTLGRFGETLGMDPVAQQYLARQAREVADFVPVVGGFTGADDARQSFAAGNPVGGAFETGLTALGAFGGFGGMLSGAGRKIAAELARSSVANPKTIRRMGRERGIPEDDLGEFAGKVGEFRTVQQGRMAARGGGDPLENAAYTRGLRLEEMKLDSQLQASPAAAHWAPEDAARVRTYGRVGSTVDMDRAARGATLSAVEKHLRDNGMKISHASKEGGRTSSLYVDVPGKGRVRISDHDLPMTAGRATQEGGGWVDEVVIGNGLGDDLPSILRKAFSPIS